jgi:hypothetical protein
MDWLTPEEHQELQMGHPRNTDKRKLVQDERSRRMAELVSQPLLTLADIALYLDMPMSTLHRLRAQGKGPRTFTIGRKVYARRPDFNAWIDGLAKVSAGH